MIKLPHSLNQIQQAIIEAFPRKENAGIVENIDNTVPPEISYDTRAIAAHLDRLLNGLDSKTH